MESSCSCGGSKGANCTCGADCKCNSAEKSCCSTTAKPTGCSCADGICGDSCGKVGSCCGPVYTGVAAVRKPAPQFETMAYHNGFKKVSLSDYKGMFTNLFIKLYYRKIRSIVLLPLRFYLCLPHRNYSILRQGKG